MAGAVSGTVNLSAGFLWGFQQGANFPVNNLSIPFPSLTMNLGGGTGANNYINLYAGTRTVASGTPDVLHLTTGGSNIKNPDSTACNFADVMVWFIRSNGTAGQVLTMGGGTNDITTLLGSTGTIIIPNGVWIAIADPNAAAFVVTASTADTLQFVSSSGSITYDLLLAGH